MEASHRHGGGRPTSLQQGDEHNINDGQLQFGIVHIYDIFIIAQACTDSQIGRRLSASLFK